MWGRDAAPEENRHADLRPLLRKSGLAFREPWNGPPQGLVCPPPGLESPGPSLPVAHTLPAEEAVSEGKGLNISPQAGRREAALNNRTRPLGAPHPSLTTRADAVARQIGLPKAVMPAKAGRARRGEELVRAARSCDLLASRFRGNDKGAATEIEHGHIAAALILSRAAYERCRGQACHAAFKD